MVDGGVQIDALRCVGCVTRLRAEGVLAGVVECSFWHVSLRCSLAPLVPILDKHSELDTQSFSFKNFAEVSLFTCTPYMSLALHDNS